LFTINTRMLFDPPLCPAQPSPPQPEAIPATSARLANVTAVRLGTPPPRRHDPTLK
jgi:hypothetical protein